MVLDYQGRDVGHIAVEAITHSNMSEMLQAAYADDTLTNLQVTNAFEDHLGMSFDQFRRDRKAFRDAHGLGPLPRGVRSGDSSDDSPIDPSTTRSTGQVWVLDEQQFTQHQDVQLQIVNALVDLNVTLQNIEGRLR